QGVRDLKIDLASGRPLAPKRDLVSHAGAVSTLADESDSRALGPPACRLREPRFDSPRLLHVSSRALFARATECSPPLVPRVARRARLYGTSTVEVLVAATGEVACVRARGLHVMGVDKAFEAAVLRWRFQPFVVDGKPVPAVGRVAFR